MLSLACGDFLCGVYFFGFIFTAIIGTVVQLKVIDQVEEDEDDMIKWEDKGRKASLVRTGTDMVAETLAKGRG